MDRKKLKTSTHRGGSKRRKRHTKIQFDRVLKRFRNNKGQFVKSPEKRTKGKGRGLTAPSRKPKLMYIKPQGRKIKVSKMLGMFRRKPFQLMGPYKITSTLELHTKYQQERVEKQFKNQRVIAQYNKLWRDTEARNRLSPLIHAIIEQYQSSTGKEITQKQAFKMLALAKHQQEINQEKTFHIDYEALPFR